LVFARNRPGKECSVLVANADGTGEYALATREYPNHFANTNVLWSRDGRTIMAAAYDGTRKIGLVSVDVSTGSVQSIGDKQWDGMTSIAWPDESHLVIAATDYAVADTAQIWEVSLPARRDASPRTSLHTVV
jgi:WD40 repeat protein